MSTGTWLKLGSWNTICDRCGFKFKAEELRKDWQGLMVCSEDYELRNPQDFIRVPPEHIVPPWTRPRPEDVFTDVVYICSIEGSAAVAGQAVAGCALVGSWYPPFIPGPSAVAGKAIAGRAIAGNL